MLNINEDKEVIRNDRKRKNDKWKVVQSNG
ncbi:Uncharacterised protein [uncultured Blautia sp.]|nr:Uncharacterised protein [uncultured Blautia sp.]